VVPHLLAQGLEEGDEHPHALLWSMGVLSCGAWLTLPFSSTKELLKTVEIRNVLDFFKKNSFL